MMDVERDESPREKHPMRLWSVLMATFVAALGPFSFGYGLGYSSAAVTELENPDTNDLYLDADGITWFGVSFPLNCISRKRITRE